MSKILNKVERDLLGKRVATFYNKNNQNSSLAYKHFMDEGICKKTIGRILNRLKTAGKATTNSPPGRKMKNSNVNKITKIKNMLKKNPSISNRKCAAKMKISTTTYRRIVKNKLGLKTFKKTKAPKYIKDQKQRAKKGCAKIYRTLCDDTVLIIDDETYVCDDPNQNKLTRYYRAKSKNDIPQEQKLQQVQKFPKKYLIWQAIDSEGNKAECFISESNMNSDIYLNECLKKRLIKFIEKYHKNKKILFWPDLASSHYADICTSFLKEKNINFVEKSKNPPNVPQARPIEKFWAIMKRKYARRQTLCKKFKLF